VDLAIGLMQAVMPLAERAARLPAGPSIPQLHAGMSFITLRDSAALAPGTGPRAGVRRAFRTAGRRCRSAARQRDARAVAAADQLASLASRAHAALI